MILVRLLLFNVVFIFLAFFKYKDRKTVSSLPHDNIAFQNRHDAGYRCGVHMSFGHRQPISALIYVKDDQPHRLDGPAVEYVKYRTEWYKNGQRHREDGPAFIYHEKKQNRQTMVL